MTRARTLPRPWDERPVDDLFPVDRCGVFLAGRMPRDPAVAIARWFAETSSLFDDLAGEGCTLPDLGLMRFDPTTVKVVQSVDSAERRREETEHLLRLALDGNLELTGHLSDSPPEGPFVYQWVSAIHLDPPDWFRLHLGVELVSRDVETVRSQLGHGVVDLLRVLATEPWVDYAEAGPGMPGVDGSTEWEDDIEPDTMGEGARLAPRWLRGLGPATFLHDRVVAALGGRQRFRDEHLGAEIVEVEHGLLVITRSDLWAGDSEVDRRLRAVVEPRLVVEDLFWDLREFSASFAGNFVEGPTASALEEHFSALDDRGG